MNPVSDRTDPFARVLGGAAATALVQALYLGSRFLLTPFVLARAGLEAYGFWSLLFAVLGVLGVQRMGLVSASVPLAARALAEGDAPRAARILRSVAGLATLLALLFVVATLQADGLLLRLLGVGPELEASARFALRLTVGATGLALAFGGYQSYLESDQRYATVKLVDGSAQLGEAVLLGALLWAGLGLEALGTAYALRLLVPIPIYAWLSRRAGRQAPLWPSLPDRRELRSILRLGLAIQGLGTVHMGVAALPRLVLARVTDLGTLGLFEVSRKLIEFAAALPSKSLEPLVAASGAAGSAAASRQARRVATRTSTRLVATVGLLPLGLLAVMGPAVGVAWLGVHQPSVPAVLALLAPAAWLHLCTGPTTAVLRGDARPRAELAYSGLWLLLLAALLPIAAPQGVVAAAGAVAVAQAIASLLLFWMALGQVGLRARELASDLVRPCAALALPLVAAAVLGQIPADAARAEAIRAVAAGAGLAIVLALPTCWWLVLCANERAFVEGRLRRSLLSVLNPSPLKP
ncbi:MAG: hypothetical protein AAFZ65_03235 [Planctomycetota bacterium]